MSEEQEEYEGPTLEYLFTANILDIRRELPERIKEEDLEQITATWTMGALRNKKGCSSTTASAIFELAHFEKIKREFPKAKLFLSPTYYENKDSAILVARLPSRIRWVLLAPVVLKGESE
jgi:hypothetical protein